MTVRVLLAGAFLLFAFSLSLSDHPAAPAPVQAFRVDCTTEWDACCMAEDGEASLGLVVEGCE